jgi:2-polyprenyl-6-methoxyphenol hydroxylase-like FAD-dependent oxidoreductase
MTDSKMGPLQNGGHVVIIGGGPGGAACAIALRRLAQSLDREIWVTVYEGKTFAGERHYNQCVGIASPPIRQILEDELGVPFPWHLVQRHISGYVLHGERRSLALTDTSEELSYALRRIMFDAYLLEQAQAVGTEIVHSRVTDVEIDDDGVIIYSDSDNRRADVLVGAFGLDSGTASALARATPYRSPRFLDTVVSKIYPPSDYPELAAAHAGEVPSGRIHAFMPATPHIEFAAISPKADYLTVNIAGARVTSAWMDYFLQGPAHKVLPFTDHDPLRNPHDFGHFRGRFPNFKGRFPISVAKDFYGDRYVTIGDAAGLVRAFKGKGINSACLTGLWAARTIMTVGISANAFKQGYVPPCQEILCDIPYGHLVRYLVINASRLRQVDLALALGKKYPPLRQALFDAVSGSRPYRSIISELLSAPFNSLLWRRSRAQR